MSEITIKAVDPKSKKSATVKFTLPDTLSQAGQMWTEAVALAKLKRTVVIDIQAKLRNWMTQEKPLTDAEMQAAINKWKPGETPVRMSFADKVAKKYEKGELSEGDLEDMIAKLKKVRETKKTGK